MAPIAFSPQDQPFTPFMPDFGAGNSPTAQLLTQAIAAFTGGQGGALLGMGDRNMFDRLNHMRLTEQHKRIVENAARRDEETIVQAIRSGYLMSGQPFGADQLRTAQGVAGIFPSVAPFAVQMIPEILDRLGGDRGSIAVMADSIFSGSQRRLDPLTGALTMSSASTEHLIGQMHETMFAGSRYHDQRLRAGQTGQLFSALQARGLVPATLDPLAALAKLPESRLSGLMDDAGLAGRSLEELLPDQREKLLQLPAAQSEIRNFDSQRAIRTVKDWSKAVEAMQEIFGSAGYPDAPMPMLVEAINRFTQGGMQQLSPERIAHDIRTTAILAKQTGIGMEASGMMHAASADRLAAMGIEPIFAAKTTQDALAFVRGMGLAGVGSSPTWGLSDFTKLADMRSRAVEGAIGSSMGRQLGTALGMQKSAGILPGSDAESYLKAAAAGQTEFEMGGKMVSMDLAQSDFLRIMAAGNLSGYDENEIRMLLQYSSEARRHLMQTPGAITAVKRSQRIQLANAEVAGGASGQAKVALRELLGDNIDPSSLAAKFGKTFANTVFGKDFDPTLLSDDNRDELNEMVAERLRETVKTEALSGNVAAQEMMKRMPTDAELDKYLAPRAGDLRSAADTAMQSAGLSTLENNAVIHSERVQGLTARAEAEASARSEISGAMGRIGKGTHLQRFMEGLLSSGDTGENLTDIAFRTIGGVRGRGIMDAIGTDKFKELQKQYEELKESEHAVATATDSERAELQDLHHVKARAMGEEIAKVRDIAAAKGFMGDSQSSADLKAAVTSVEHVRNALSAGELTEESALEQAQRVRGLISGLTDNPVELAGANVADVKRIIDLKRLQDEIQEGGVTRDDDKKLGKQQRLLAELDESLNDDESKKAVESYRNRMKVATREEREAVEKAQSEMAKAISSPHGIFSPYGDVESTLLAFQEKLEAIKEPTPAEVAEADEAGGTKHFSIANLYIHTDGPSQLDLADDPRGP